MYALSEISSWPDGAQAALEAKTLDHVAELLESPQSGVRQGTCWMVGRFAKHASTAMAILGLKPCPQLVGLLCDQPVKVVEAATYALSQIVFWPNGAQAALEAKTLDHVAELLQSPQSGVQQWTCQTVGSFARHESTAVAVLGLKPCPQLVGLLHDQPVEVIEAAMYALSLIGFGLMSKVRQQTCWMVGRFAKHKSTAVAVLGLKPCPQLVGLLHDQPVEVIEAAMYALHEISSWPDVWGPGQTCWMVGNFARHESTAMAVLGLKPCPQLVGLLRDQPVKVIETAMYALYEISYWPDSAQAALEVKTLDHVVELLESPQSEVRKWTCGTVGRFAEHESTAVAILGLKPCPQLVGLLCDQPVEVVEGAMFALSQIVFWPDGAQVALEAKTLDHVAELLQSPESEVRRQTCWTVGRFALHESTAMAVLGLKPCPQLVGLLRDQPVEVIEATMYALYEISSWPDGAQAALEANTLDHVAELLESPQSGVQQWTRWIVGRFAKHESTAVAVLGLNIEELIV
ncbi:armadillo-type protein [Mycena leptocephala]|nr:armadillo-type protein [Mycena leptocephala]